MYHHHIIHTLIHDTKYIKHLTLNNGKQQYLVAKGKRFGYAYQRISAHLFFNFVFVFIQKFLIPKAEKDNKL